MCSFNLEYTARGSFGRNCMSQELKQTSTFKTQAILTKPSLTLHTYTSSIIGIRTGVRSLSPHRYSCYILCHTFHIVAPKELFIMQLAQYGSNYMLKVVVLQFPDQTPILSEVATLALSWDSSKPLCCYSYCVIPEFFLYHESL